MFTRPRQPTLRVPTGPFELNTESPQAKGLLNWWPAAGATNGFLRDYCTGGRAVFSGGVSLGVRETGRVVDFDRSANGVAEQIAPDSLYVGKPLTLVWFGFLNNFSDVHGFLAKCTSNGGIDSPFDFRTSDQNLFLVKANAGGNGGYYSYFEGIFGEGEDILLNVPQMYAVTSGPNVEDQPQFYCNGLYLNSYKDFGSGTGPTTGDNAVLSIGRRPDGFIELDGSIIDTRIYQRILSKQEIWSLWDPRTRYDLYRPMRSKTFSFPAPGAVPRPLHLPRRVPVTLGDIVDG